MHIANSTFALSLVWLALPPRLYAVVGWARACLSMPDTGEGLAVLD